VVLQEDQALLPDSEALPALLLASEELLQDSVDLLAVLVARRLDSGVFLQDSEALQDSLALQANQAFRQADQVFPQVHQVCRLVGLLRV